MAHKELKYDSAARKALEAGVDAVANAVKVTLGPKGRYVVLDKKFGAPTITNDGVSIAREIELDDPYENMGAQLVKEVATGQQAAWLGAWQTGTGVAGSVAYAAGCVGSTGSGGESNTCERSGSTSEGGAW